MQKFFLLTLFSFALIPHQGFAQQLEYKPGSGLTVESNEEKWKIRLLGYVQSTFTYHTVQDENSVDNEFFVRRARLDFILDLHEKYQWFIELDGRGSRTELVLAQFDIRYHPDHKIRIGKFITPFSPENSRSSRALTTVERYNALNSMFLLPSLDTQYGIMFIGDIQKFRYFLSVTNGNGKASANLRENNNAKDLQVRLTNQVSESLSFGAGINYSKELSQSLGLYDHAFKPINRVPISGERIGYLLDAEYTKNRLLLRSEYFQYKFLDDIAEDLVLDGFAGGYAELGYFLSGDTHDGFQLMGRFEHAHYLTGQREILGVNALNSYILGHNWYLDGLFRLQTNVIFEAPDREGSVSSGRWDGERHGLIFLIMAQVKL
jgi:phosphate-selective porin